MSRGLSPGETLRDFELPDENGTLHRLSELQGDDPMVLMLGRGEPCPRERQHQHELLKLQEWAPVAFTQLVTVLPNDLHDVHKMKIATGAWWTFLSDGDLELQTALDIKEYTDTHHDATVPHTLVLGPGLTIDQGLRRLLVLGGGPRPTSCGPTWATCSGARRPTSIRPSPPCARPGRRRGWQRPARPAPELPAASPAARSAGCRGRRGRGTASPSGAVRPGVGARPSRPRRRRASARRGRARGR